MGKRLQKLLHGIVPSWLSKVKPPSPDAHAKKLLPFFTAGDDASDSKSPSSSTPSQSCTGGLVFGDGNLIRQDDSFPSAPSLSPLMRRKEPEATKDRSRHTSEESHGSLQDKPQQNHFKFQQLLLEDEAVFLHSVSDQHEIDRAAVTPAHSALELNNMQAGIYDGQECQGESGYFEYTYQEMLQEDEDNADRIEKPERRAKNDDIEAWMWEKSRGEKRSASFELPESICEVVGHGCAVVEQSLDPQFALWESMVEMILGNGLWELSSLEFLLNCYLSLNEPQLHPIIHSSFLQVLEDLQIIL